MRTRNMKGLLNWRNGIGLLLVAAVLLFVANDAFLYSETVAKVIAIEQEPSYSGEGPNGEQEPYYEQTIQARILNGSRKGEVITLSNTYSYSGVNDERYAWGNQLFVNTVGGGTDGVILGKKRDTSLALLAGLFVWLLMAVNGRKGGMVLVSLILNIGIFVIALSGYDQGKDLVRISVWLRVIFSVLTVLFAGGFHRKTGVAIVSTLLTTLLCYAVYEGALHTSDRLPYEMMDYIVNPADLPELLFSGVLMGSLGAVMDVCISIAAGVSEILEQTPDISRTALIRSIREMGYDIMGTMINVLFFTYISSSIPIFVVKIRNGYTLYHLIQFQSVFESVRFLMGAIGIVLAIPVAGFCSVLLMHGIGRKEGDRI